MRYLLSEPSYPSQNLPQKASPPGKLPPKAADEVPDCRTLNPSLSLTLLPKGVIPIATITFPSTNAVTFVDNSTAFKNTGQHISGVSSFTATGHATVSGLAAGERVQYWLVMYAGSEHIFNQTSDTQTFKIPTLSLREKKLVQYTYHVKILTDRNGWAIQTDYGVIAYQDAFTLDTYTPPALVSLSAERYSTRPTDTGTGTIDTRDNSGEYVRFSFKLVPAVTSVASNTYTLSVKATSDSGTTKQKASAYTGTAALTKTNDTTIFPAASFSFSTAENWTFTFTVTDKVTSISSTCQVSKASAILDVEPGGVAVGGFLSEDKIFANNNILRGTGSPLRVLDKDTDAFWTDGAWGKTGGGNATVSVISVTNCPDSGVATGFSLSGNTSGNKEVAQYQVPFTVGQTYTASCWARVPSGSAVLSCYIYDHTASTATSRPINKITISNTAWKHYSGTVTFSGTASNSSIHFGIYGAGSLEICGFKLEKGSVSKPVWSPAPEDNAVIVPFDKPMRFETSPECGTILRGGLWDNLGYRMDYVNNTTLLPIDNAKFEPYDKSASATTPMVSRVGPIVFLEGMLTNKVAISLNANGVVLTTLPGWARPRMIISQVCQGSDANIFWLRIRPDGEVTISRYRNSSSYGTAVVGSQFPFTMSWLAADAAPPLPEYEE